MHRTRSVVAFTLVGLSAACSSSSSLVEGPGSSDAEPALDESRDAGVNDAATADATIDAGRARDAGGSTNDGGSTDDGGASSDGGGATDDGGTTDDGGASSDGGGASEDGGASSDGGVGIEGTPGSRDEGGLADATAPVPDSGGRLADASAPVPDGGVFVQFVKSDESTYFDPAQEGKSTGAVTFGVANPAASDGLVATLTRVGGRTSLGTDGAEEIVSQRAFSFGTFRFRLAFATCAPTEEVVNGPFAYFNDGSKAPDGNVINREIDIEILCGEPWLINLTIWTEYTDATHLKNQARVVNTKTGEVDIYAPDQSNGVQTGSEKHPELIVPGWPQEGTFYEMGWTWAPGHLRYFMAIGGTDVTLWDATDAARIPQAPMEQHFNLWAPGIHWSSGSKAAVPANPATLTLDWFRYDPQ